MCLMVNNCAESKLNTVMDSKAKKRLLLPLI